MTTIVDAHQHFWNIAQGNYPWLTPDMGPLYRTYGRHFATIALTHVCSEQWDDFAA